MTFPVHHARHKTAFRVERRIPFTGASIVIGNKYLCVGLICNAVQACKEQHRVTSLCPVENFGDLVGLRILVPFYAVNCDRRVFIDRDDAVQVTCAADDMLYIDFSNKRIFFQQRLIILTQPCWEFQLKTALKQTTNIAEIRRAEHHRCTADVRAQLSQRCFSNLRPCGRDLCLAAFWCLDLLRMSCAAAGHALLCGVRCRCFLRLFCLFCSQVERCARFRTGRRLLRLLCTGR